HLARPLAEALRLLRAVIGRVDLDRGEVLARVGELLRLREPLGIEHAAPGREVPAADAAIDMSGCHRGSLAHVPAKWTPVRRQEHAQTIEPRACPVPKEQDLL